MNSATDGPRQVVNRLVPLTTPVVITAPQPTRAPTSRWVSPRSAVVALVFLGVVLRLIPLLGDRCLWLDEAMLALNLIDRTPRQLLEPLDWNQGAPAGFLLAVKASIMLFGDSEWALRLVPFLGSVAGLAGFAWLCRRLLPDGAAVVGIGLYAIGPYLISYTAECKQYATDAALAVGLLAAAFGLLVRESGFRRWAVLAAAGAAAVWFSHPAAFVLGGIGTALFADAVAMKDRRRALAAAATIGCWLVSFGMCYLVSLKQLGANKFLLDYWTEHFMPVPPMAPGDFLWLADHYFGFLAYPGGLGGTEFKLGGVAAVLSVVGVAGFVRDRWPVAVALVMPGLLALFASALHKYPFAGRLMLFLVPFMLLAVARGAWAVAAALRPTQPLAAVLVLGLLFVAPAVETVQQLRRPDRTEQLTPVLADVSARWQPGDKVYLYYGGIPAFLYYTRDTPFPPGVVRGTEHRDVRTGYRDELRKLAGEPRVWVVFSHRHRAEESLIRAYAEGLGECKEQIHHPGATAFLYDFSKPFPDPK